MVFKKSQYTHDYKVPHWNRHYNHYKEKVDYRVQRRVLEYQHEPFEWQDPDSDWEHELEDDRMSDSAYDGGTQLERCEKLHRHREREVQTPAWEKRDDIQIEKNNNLNNSNAYQVPPLPASALERNDKPIRPKKPRPKSAKATVGGAEKSAIRPPFLPYGYMDKERHVGTQRTHNVKATVADPLMIYPAALRARKRQQLDVQRQYEAEQKQSHVQMRRERAPFSAPPKVQEAWQTEYSRSYSASRR